MSRAIGFRAETDSFCWAVVDGTVEAPELVGAEKYAAPEGVPEAAALVAIRERGLYLLRRFNPSCVGIRYPEYSPRGGATESARRRCRVEGVLLELASSAGFPVITGAFGTIAKNLGAESAKAYLTRSDLRGLDWEKYGKNQREAILVAASVVGK